MTRLDNSSKPLVCQNRPLGTCSSSWSLICFNSATIRARHDPIRCLWCVSSVATSGTHFTTSQPVSHNDDYSIAPATTKLVSFIVLPSCCRVGPFDYKQDSTCSIWIRTGSEMVQIRRRRETLEHSIHWQSSSSSLWLLLLFEWQHWAQ